MFPISSVLLLSCLLVTVSALSARTEYGDFAVYLFKDGSSKKQLNVFEGDLFLVEFTLRRSGRDEAVDIYQLNVTQSVKGLSEDKNVNFILKRVENNLFNVTSVNPVNKLGGTVVSASVNHPHKYITELEVSNSEDKALSTTNMRKIVLSSYGIVTNSGIQVQICPIVYHESKPIVVKT
uniref:Uncharacterized protein n=1 Tax=Cacopsylla melanoneura TaxID=428564 RepID=A0A8D8U7B2_9HEMI